MRIPVSTPRVPTSAALLLIAALASVDAFSSFDVASAFSPVAAAGDVCSLLSIAKVSSLTGRTYTAARPETIANGVESCAYSAAEGYALSVTIYSAPNRSTLDSLVMDIGGPSPRQP